MEDRDLKQILAAKQRRRQELARLPIEEKLRVVVRLQEMAAPILRLRGKVVRFWNLETPTTCVTPFANTSPTSTQAAFPSAGI